MSFLCEPPVVHRAIGTGPVATPITGQQTGLTESQNHRITKLQNHKITESQNHKFQTIEREGEAFSRVQSASSPLPNSYSIGFNEGGKTLNIE